MLQFVVAVWDSATRAYGRPAFVAARGAAVRSFVDEVNRHADDNVLAKHPVDFELHMLATWEDSTGQFAPLPEPELLMRGKDAVNVSQ